MHQKAYHVLRTVLQDEVFTSGFTLPRCLPPEGAYNWSPPVTTNVETLTIPGEKILLDDVLTVCTVDDSIQSPDCMSGDDDRDIEA